MIKDDDLSRLDAAYQRYGFKLESERPGLRVYTARFGGFFFSELVKLNDRINSGTEKVELEKMGFSCREVVCESVEETEKILFKQHFQFLSSIKRLHMQYRNFKKAQTNYLGSQYKYISSRYEYNGSLQSGDLIKDLTNIFIEDGAHLIFLEAAAGFGKTCSAYEVLNQILSISDNVIPIFTELSRNRGARIFRYVLLDEIDRNYDVSSSVVMDEITAGRMPLIIDGFDELISKSNSQDNSDSDIDFVNSEPMLQTIAMLLRNESKVLITTRSSAVYVSSEFETWLSSLTEDGVQVHQFLLKNPLVEDWFEGKPARIRSIIDSGVPIEQISNPVLLSHLVNLTDAEFESNCSTSEDIISFYFSKLLSREKIRQDLMMEENDQLYILKRIAEYMLDNDVTAEAQDVLRKVIFDDVDCLKILERTSHLYLGESRISIPEIVDKIIVHALFDRNRTENLISFINDFVLGALQGEVVCTYKDKDWVGSSSQLDRILTAFSCFSEKDRTDLWEHLSLMRDAGDQLEKLKIDTILKQKPVSSYESITIEEYEFNRIDFKPPINFTNCTFVRCQFDLCVFYTEAFCENIGFVDCVFRSCSHVNFSCDLYWEQSCSFEKSDDLKAIFTNSQGSMSAGRARKAVSYERLVLLRFWPQGRGHFTLKKRASTLFKGSPVNKHRYISEAIETLVKKGILISDRGKTFVLNSAQLDEISSILGRKED